METTKNLKLPQYTGEDIFDLLKIVSTDIIQILVDTFIIMRCCV